ncbi:MAG: MFS transporter [Hyphomicrobiaceae bacterium]
MQRDPTAAFAATLALITLISPLALHLYLPALPVVKTELGISHALAQLTFGASLVTMGVATLAYGSLADRMGRRPTLLAGLAMFVAGSVLSAVAAEIWSLVAGRIVQAAGAGCSLTLVRTIARDAYGQDRLVKAIAYLTMCYTMGPIMASVIGGMLIDAFGWRMLFALAALLGLLVLGAALAFLPETRPAEQRAAASGHWLEAYTALLSHVRFNAFVLQTGLNTSAFMVTATAASVIVQHDLGRSSAEFGLFFALFPLGLLAGSAIASRLGGRVAIEAMVLVGSLVLALAVAVQGALLMSGIITPLTLCLPGFFITFGNGLSIASAQAGAMATIPRHAGTAAGIGVFMQMLLSGLAVQLYGFLADGSVVPLVLTAGMLAVGTVVAGVLTFLLGTQRA